MMETIGPVEVERLGGFAGFGLPGSRLRSCGHVEAAHLAAADRQALTALFDKPPAAPPLPDGFRYRLTRQTPAGPQAVEIAEQHVPESIKGCVRDELI